MSEKEVLRFIELVKNRIATLICGNDNSLKNDLINIFNNYVNVKIGDPADNINFAAYTGSSIKHRFDSEGNLFVQTGKINVGIPLPPARGNLNFNGWMVDVHHELFHAFTKILSGEKKCQRNGNIYYVPNGGKISIFLNENGNFKNKGDVSSSVLINELITDMIAYCCTYETFDLIFNSHGLDVINQKYGHYNGYFELFQFGLVLYHAFANFEPNYDHILESGRGIFDNKYSGSNLYYNDILYGVMKNPSHINTQFVKYSTEEEYEKLNDSCQKILSDFSNNGRKVNETEIKKAMEIIRTFFNNKMNYFKKEGQISLDIINDLENRFKLQYSKAQKSYGQNGSFHR